MNKKALLFPGQGAQYVGMGKDFYEAFAIARHTFQEADDTLGTDFSSLIFQGDPQELTATKNSQLAIYIVSMAIWRVIQEQFCEIKPVVCAGLSLGEYTALTASGKISFIDCLHLVRKRAQYMHEASLELPGTMQVVLGLSPEDVASAIVDCEGVWLANVNCPGQVVIAGKAEALTQAGILLKEKGAKRVLPLDVSGAFHSGLMQSAQDRLQPYIESVALLETGIQCVSNVVGRPALDLQEIRSCLLKQVTQPVLWEKGIRVLEEQGITTYYEIGPGKTLAGMNKRIGVLAPTLSVEKVIDLEEIAHAITQR